MGLQIHDMFITVLMFILQANVTHSTRVRLAPSGPRTGVSGMRVGRSNKGVRYLKQQLLADLRYTHLLSNLFIFLLSAIVYYTQIQL